MRKVVALLMGELRSGHWTGELASSSLATATAVSALSVVRRERPALGGSLGGLIERGIHYLARSQNVDGGWGDTDRSHSNIATTYLGLSAFHLVGVANEHETTLNKAVSYRDSMGGIPALRKRYGIDKTFVVPILTNAALAGLVPWSEVSPLPFEAACVPQSWYRFIRLPVVSYAIPALVAIGQAKFFHDPPWILLRWLRSASVNRSLSVLKRMQPESGGYLEATPLTSFVLMSLAATGRADHTVSRKAIDFLRESARPDGSWPIDTNLATWVTTLAIHGLVSAGVDLPTSGVSLDWLLACQHRERHPFTGAEPGGWGWTNLSGAVPDADDTPGALLALAAWWDAPSASDDDRRRIASAAKAGMEWLLDLQNSDGGWPTFCRGWGTLPFDRSGVDLTAHAIRALRAWQGKTSEIDLALHRRRLAAIERGFRFIEKSQRSDGSWIPLWFGNQDHPEEENPIYGTAKVLFAYRDMGMLECDAAARGKRFLLASQKEDGSWGATESRLEAQTSGSIEETSLAIEALCCGERPSLGGGGVERGLAWLCHSIENGRVFQPSPIGLYFAKLWYYERLYPLTFAVSALGRALVSGNGNQATDASY